MVGVLAAAAEMPPNTLGGRKSGKEPPWEKLPANPKGLAETPEEDHDGPDTGGRVSAGGDNEGRSTPP